MLRRHGSHGVILVPAAPPETVQVTGRTSSTRRNRTSGFPLAKLGVTGYVLSDAAGMTYPCRLSAGVTVPDALAACDALV